jgi:glycosyltransferase involved in cell wall biosynthesis
MGRGALRIAILTNVVPSYRQGFFDRLFARDDVSVHVYCQAKLPGTNVKTIHGSYPHHITVIPARGMDREALVWQRTPWREVLFGYDVVFVAGNPRVVSHAVAATLLRVLRRNVVLWTMAHSFGANKWSERVRLLWTRGFTHVLLYTDAEVRALRARGFARHVLHGMNNGLDQNHIDRVSGEWDEARLAAWRHANDLSARTVVLTCTRLDPKNRLELMMRALPSIALAIPDVTWCIIGGGGEEPRLKAMAQEMSLSNRVRFVGERYDEADLAPWFLSAQTLVHPGAIGLSLLHAFGYGLPVVTNGNAGGHGPEFGAFEEGLSGRTFQEGDAEDLSRVLVELLQDPLRLVSMRHHVRRIVREQFNVDVMVDRFVAAARAAVGGRGPAAT